MSGDQGKLIVLAIGGNSLITDSAHRKVEDQYASTLETCRRIVKLLEAGHRVVITHGNGPQVGFILRRSELASHELHIVPLDSCGADTQGAIGYLLQRAMYNCMLGWPRRIPVATVVTQVLVDRDDPAFQEPTKPIGSFLDEETATQRRQQDGWHIKEDAGRGFRRVVASPRPKRIVEIDAIRSLIDRGFVVVAVGGGGIPVIEDEEGSLVGADAVIDKDRASGLLAREVDADVLLISTSVEKAYLRFGKPDQQPLDVLTVAEARRYIQEGHFAPGSMRPKIDAMANFVESGGREAMLTDPPNLLRAIAGETGTRVVP
ncbi:carbamate kinase [Planctomycetota bacterium]